MSELKFKKYKTMGVMNITPNSFSDGGKLKTSRLATSRFHSFLKDFDIVDVGAESTAPFNSSIDAKTELSRLESFFYPLFDHLEDPETVISIDTYRPEVFYEVALGTRKAWPKTSLIFNDVSGKVDRDLLALFREDLAFDYVLSHNLCPERDLAGDHMKYCEERDGEMFMENLLAFFHERLALLRPFGREVVVDPCFGFSKTRAQNHFLLKNFEGFLKELDGDHATLAGISRKSFLRFPKDMDAKIPANQEHLDRLQGILAFHLLNGPSKRELIFRSHCALPFIALKDALKILED